MNTDTVRFEGQAYRVLPTLEDGNCLFRALSWWVYGSQSGHLELRQQAICYIQDNWSDFKHFLGYESPQHYEAVMGRLGTYAGHPEVVAVARLFEAKISIYFRNAEDHKPAVIVPPGSYDKHFTILHSGAYDFGHYDVIY